MSRVSEIEPVTTGPKDSSRWEAAETTRTNATQVLVFTPDELSDFDAQARASILRGLNQPGNKYLGSFAGFAV